MGHGRRGTAWSPRRPVGAAAARTVAVGVVLGGVLLGCSPDLSYTQGERSSALERVDLVVGVAPGGAALYEVNATFADDGGGVVPVPPGAQEVQVEGDGPVGGGEVVATTRQATVRYVLPAAVAVHDEVAVVELPVLTSPSDATRQDPAVAVSATVSVPEPAGAGLEAQWNDGLHQTVVVDGAEVRLDGDSPVWTDSELVLVASPGAFPDVAPTPGPGRAQLDAALAQQAATTAQLESTLDAQDREAQIVDLAVLGVGAGVSLLMVFQWVRLHTAERRDRRRREATFPDHLVDPPDELDPALVALLDEGGRRVDRDAVAGVVLDLAHRREVALDAYADERFVLRVPASAEGRNPSEQVVLDGLRAAHPDGEVVGPPAWPAGRPGWWGPFRRDLLRRARAEGLVRRRFRFVVVGPFAAGIVAATWPVWAGERVWLVPVLCIGLGLLFAVPLGGGFELTERGFDAACRWRAFGRYARDHGDLSRVGAPGVAVWGPYLSYGAALGIAPRAVHEVSPDGLPERPSREDHRVVQDDVDAEAEAEAPGG